MRRACREPPPFPNEEDHLQVAADGARREARRPRDARQGGPHALLPRRGETAYAAARSAGAGGRGMPGGAAAGGCRVWLVRPTVDRPPVVHSDGGAVCMGDDRARACEAGHVTRPMPRKARSPDIARREGLFGTLKSDSFGGRDWAGVTFEEFSRRPGACIEWYRSGKARKALGWKTIRRRREEPGYTA